MGSHQDEYNRDFNEDQKRVIISKSFDIMTKEVS